MSQGGVLKIDSPSSILRQKNCSPTEQIYQVPKKNPCTIHSVSKKMTLISRLIKNLLINTYIVLNYLFWIMHPTTLLGALSKREHMSIAMWWTTVQCHSSPAIPPLCHSRNQGFGSHTHKI